MGAHTAAVHYPGQDEDSRHYACGDFRQIIGRRGRFIDNPMLICLRGFDDIAALFGRGKFPGKSRKFIRDTGS